MLKIADIFIARFVVYAIRQINAIRAACVYLYAYFIQSGHNAQQNRLRTQAKHDGDKLRTKAFYFYRVRMTCAYIYIYNITGLGG